jgi:branched-chain amino acid aminotransferase
MPPYAYFHKQFMPLQDAKVNILTHSMHYGTAVFEGIRGNWDEEKGVCYIFRVKEHYERLLQGCKIMKMKMPHTMKELVDITVELVEKSGFTEDVYIRPIAYKGAERVGVRLHDVEDDFAIVVTTLPNYLDLEKGIRCCVSSWRRMDDSMIPSRGKISGAYVTSALAKSEAIQGGFDEAIMLTGEGHVAEGSGENLFMVMKGKLITPPSSDCILLGITRETAMQLAKNELGIDTIERSIDRSDLYIADEVFLTGTAAHITQVLEIDEYQVGNGKLGKITAQLQKLYFGVIQGKNPKYSDYCTPAYPKVKKSKK